MCRADLVEKTQQVSQVWFAKARSFVEDNVVRLRSTLTERLLELVEAHARQGTLSNIAEEHDFHTFYMSLTSVGKTYITMQSALRRIRFEKAMNRLIVTEEETVSFVPGIFM